MRDLLLQCLTHGDADLLIACSLTSQSSPEFILQCMVLPIFCINPEHKYRETRTIFRTSHVTNEFQQDVRTSTLILFFTFFSTKSLLKAVSCRNKLSIQILQGTQTRRVKNHASETIFRTNHFMHTYTETSYTNNCRVIRILIGSP